MGLFKDWEYLFRLNISKFGFLFFFFKKEYIQYLQKEHQ